MNRLPKQVLTALIIVLCSNSTLFAHCSHCGMDHDIIDHNVTQAESEEVIIKTKSINDDSAKQDHNVQNWNKYYKNGTQKRFHTPEQY